VDHWIVQFHRVPPCSAPWACAPTTISCCGAPNVDQVHTFRISFENWFTLAAITLRW
jgi:hypothetical protein